MADLYERFERCRATLEPRQQAHLLRWWDELADTERAELLSDIESIPWEQIDVLLPTHVLKRPVQVIPDTLRPVEVVPDRPPAGEELRYRAAIEQGRALLADGKVAAFTVAGGQGTRLGVDGPKGAVVVTPVGKRTLFELFACTVLAARRRYDVPIPWYVMTSRANHDQTVSFLRNHNYFGLPEADVILFSQGMLPAFDREGKALLEAKHRVVLAPDGHGGSLKALVKSGALADMRARDVEIISYFQVDNPLVRPFDPLFIGLHAGSGSEMSVKVSPKADDLERVGNVCLADGKLAVIEYSDFPEALAHERNAQGRRKFDSGNLAIHLLNVGLVDRIVGKSFQLPFSRADKTVAFIDDRGALQQPGAPNAVKLEAFVFDALPLARRTLAFEVDRADEFSPVKNAAGADSLETAQRDQVARACRWLEAAGVHVPRKTDGLPDVTIAISPLFALDADDVASSVDRLPSLSPGCSAYIE